MFWYQLIKLSYLNEKYENPFIFILIIRLPLLINRGRIQSLTAYQNTIRMFWNMRPHEDQTRNNMPDTPNKFRRMLNPFTISRNSIMGVRNIIHIYWSRRSKTHLGTHCSELHWTQPKIGCTEKNNNMGGIYETDKNRIQKW